MKEVKNAKCKIRVPLGRISCTPHEVSERETFCNNFYSTIFLQKKIFYSFLELNNYNGYVCAIYNYCCTSYL